MSHYSFQHSITPRPNSQDPLLINVLDGLLARYIERVPDAQKIVKLMSERGDQILNDHIAFRSVELTSILKIFLHLGYEMRMDDATGKPFNFEQKKLTAVWLKHPNPNVPRVFVSQFRFNEGSQNLQTIIETYLKDWKDPIDSIDLNDPNAINQYLHTGQWPTPSYADYCQMQEESEYMAWVLYNKYYLNHFTLTVHELKSFGFEGELKQTLENYQKSYQGQQAVSIIQDAQTMMKEKYKSQFKRFNAFLMEHNFDLNAPDRDYINVSPDGALLQSSTKSKLIRATFKEGAYDIPGSYVEFAYRGLPDSVIEAIITSKDPIKPLSQYEHRDGFETQNADKIFESTYTGKEPINDENKTKSTISSYDQSCKRILEFCQTLKKTSSSTN